MTVRDERREAALARIAQHVLQNGLGDSSLRVLAAAAGTSDRMLLYYFTGKDELVAAALQVIARQMAEVLEALVPAGTAFAPAMLLTVLGQAVQSEALRPFMRLWLELVCLAARGEEPFRTVAGRIADGFLAWIEARLTVADKAAAARLLAIIDGAALLGALGREGVAASALACQDTFPGRQT